MRTIQPFDYLVHLSTGEKVHLAEFDPEVVPELQSMAVRGAAGSVLSRATYAPRDVLEDAKRGQDARLKKLLRTPPVGALLRVAPELCSERKLCSMYAPSSCTTRNVTRDGGAFPECWEWEPAPGASLPFDVESGARALCTAFVLAWRRGMLAVVVESP